MKIRVHREAILPGTALLSPHCPGDNIRQVGLGFENRVGESLMVSPDHLNRRVIPLKKLLHYTFWEWGVLLYVSNYAEPASGSFLKGVQSCVLNLQIQDYKNHITTL